MADPMPAPPRSATDLFSDPLDSRPLWFKPASFLSPDFDSESYISELRTFVPFDTLRSELNSYLSSLNHELIDLINRDYADFVNLSTKLVDVDAAVVRMRAPLVELREKIEQFRGSVEVSLVAIKNGLKQRSEAAAARETLELLLDTFHVVSKVEKLIKELPSVPTDWSNGDGSLTDKNSLSNGVSVQHVENGTSVRETQSMLLERIASEMNRLKFYVTHAKNLPFIENMEKRIQNASQIVDASLGHCFADGLEHRDATAIYNCLRAYAAIDNTKNAEELFRTTIVAPLIQKIIPHGPSAVAAGSSGDELDNDYQQIKECIAKDCKFLLDISSAENSGLHVFDFLANSILKEVLSSIQKGKPSAFSPGKPAEFLKNYKASLDFLAYLEGYCPSRSAVAKFRSEAIYIEFMKQWNIGVYFSLRFQEIAKSLDDVLSTSSLVPLQDTVSGKENRVLTLKQSVTLLESMRSCWREDVLVLSCSDKFLRLSLQLLSRYSNWLSSGLNGRKSHSTNTNTGFQWAVSAAIDDFIYVIHDIRCLEEHVRGDYLEHVLQLLSSCSPDVLESVRQSILQGGQSLKSIEPLVTKAVVESLVEKSVEDLRQMKGITATYRMTNKPLPVKHSPYVAGVLRPLKAFLDGERATRYLTSESRDEILLSAATEITDRYYELASDLVNVARKTEFSLQKIRQSAQRRAGASSDVSDNNVSDTGKICMQLFLDIQEYASNLSALGVEAVKIASYRSLWQCVAPADKQNTI
ncbi:conserved oligomeric Golgi complex subunit 2 [Arachis duranensis]|uniref:Conserved oligomeric Golgi complex subunit 2 n=1 Tax=Arachis duranensis TaxID=130453 RepID=A0A6P4DCJ1_ARADU|nr:conserved oligomeric Golgi complex subunit 2 [Arachis duranensis]